MRGWGSLGPPFALFCCSQGEEGHQWNTKMREKMGKVEERREGMKQTSGKGKTRMDQGSTTQVPSTRASVMFTVMDLTWNLWAWLYVFLQESTADEHKRWAIGSFSFGSFLMQWFKCFENERSTSNSYVCPVCLPTSSPPPLLPLPPSSLTSFLPSFQKHLWVSPKSRIQPTLEQHRFGPCESTYMQGFFSQ